MNLCSMYIYDFLLRPKNTRDEFYNQVNMCEMKKNEKILSLLDIDKALFFTKIIL